MSHEKEDRRNQLSLFGLQVIAQNGMVPPTVDSAARQSTRLTLHLSSGVVGEERAKQAVAPSISEVHELLLKRVKLF